MDNIQEDFAAQLCEFDFCDIVYQLFPRDGIGYPSGDLHYKRRKTYLISSQYPIVSTCEQKALFLKSMQAVLANSHVLLHDTFLEGRWPEDFVCMPYSEETPLFIAERDRLLKQYRVNSEATLFVGYPGDDFIAYFAIYSELNQQALMQRLNQPHVKNLLRLCHFYMSRTYASLLHPGVFNGAMKAKTLDVLSMVSQGMSFKAIAEQLSLTERGVAYHYEKCREHFNAKSKADLVRLAKEHCVI